MKKTIIISVICLLAMSVLAATRSDVFPTGQTNADSQAIHSSQSPSQDYVDLGLPSGTKWKKQNEKGGFFSFKQATSRFGSKIPEAWQWQELVSSCEWVWTSGGYKVIGPNGKSIFLPATGELWEKGGLNGVGEIGVYWSSTIDETGTTCVTVIGFAWNEIDIGEYCEYEYCKLSVRLVRDN